MKDEPRGITPLYVERLIDEAGREAVFEHARRLGWDTFNSPPLWVWQQIALEVKANTPMPTGYRPEGYTPS